MNLLNLKSYRVRKEKSYYDRGYYFADIISMHRCIAALSETDAEIDIGRTGYLGSVGSFAGVNEKEDHIICYDPISLYYGSGSDDIMYVAAHEVSHVKHNDGMRLRFIDRLLVCFGISLFIATMYICLPLVVTIPILLKFMHLAARREIETQADVEAAKYVSKDTILSFIGYNGMWSRFDWLYATHATKKKFLRMLKE